MVPQMLIINMSPYVFPIPGQFRAISMQLYGTQNFHHEIRNAICDLMCQRAAYFGVYFENHEVCSVHASPVIVRVLRCMFVSSVDHGIGYSLSSAVRMLIFFINHALLGTVSRGSASWNSSTKCG